MEKRKLSKDYTDTSNLLVIWIFNELLISVHFSSLSSGDSGQLSEEEKRKLSEDYSDSSKLSVIRISEGMVEKRKLSELAAISKEVKYFCK